MLYPLKNWEKLKRGYRFGVPTSYSRFHLGLDLIPQFSLLRTPIIAWQDLEVTRAFKGAEGGNTIWIKCPNNARLFRCLHLLQPGKTGHFKEGSTIGYVGNTGMSKGKHLHIDCSKNGKLELNNLDNFEDPEILFQSMNNHNL
jgi:murein DD-endopeptidase MepM/ murein hydrolase activator NlpD